MTNGPTTKDKSHSPPNLTIQRCSNNGEFVSHNGGSNIWAHNSSAEQYLSAETQYVVSRNGGE